MGLYGRGYISLFEMDKKQVEAFMALLFWGQEENSWPIVHFQRSVVVSEEQA